jgi:hypothetical protein
MAQRYYNTLQNTIIFIPDDWPQDLAIVELSPTMQTGLVVEVDWASLTNPSNVTDSGLPYWLPLPLVCPISTGLAKLLLPLSMWAGEIDSASIHKLLAKFKGIDNGDTSTETTTT